MNRIDSLFFSFQNKKWRQHTHTTLHLRLRLKIYFQISISYKDVEKKREQSGKVEEKRVEGLRRVCASDFSATMEKRENETEKRFEFSRRTLPDVSPIVPRGFQRFMAPFNDRVGV